MKLTLAILIVVFCLTGAEAQDFCQDINSPVSFESMFDEAKTHLKRYGFVFLEGSNVRNWLIHYGASIDDIAAFENGTIHSSVPKDYESTMHFRNISLQRTVLIDDGILENGKKRRVVKHSGVQPLFRQYANEISSKDGATVPVQRSGIRTFPLPSKGCLSSTIPFTFSRIMENFISGQFVGLNNTNKDSNVTIHDQFMVRVIKKTDKIEEPTPEGIHQDGQEISGVTLTGTSNLQSGGQTRIWPLGVPIGNYDDKEFEDPHSPHYKKNCLLNRPLRNPWDTIVFNDRKVKHEARSFDGKRPVRRDVIIHMLRKPYNDGMDKMLNRKGVVVDIK